MAALPMITAIAGLAGGAMTALGQIRSGQAQNQAAKMEARQLEARAKESEAAGQRSALEQRRQSEILQSRALAAAGASGGSAVDPDVLRIISGIAGAGETNFQSELYQARSQANLQTAQAAARRFEGKQAKTAGFVGAAGTALSSIADTAMYFGQPKSAATTQTETVSEATRDQGFR